MTGEKVGKTRFFLKSELFWKPYRCLWGSLGLLINQSQEWRDSKSYHGDSPVWGKSCLMLIARVVRIRTMTTKQRVTWNLEQRERRQLPASTRVGPTRRRGGWRTAAPAAAASPIPLPAPPPRPLSHQRALTTTVATQQTFQSVASEDGLPSLTLLVMCQSGALQ